MSCPACFSGHANKSTPKGREDKIFDRPCYIAEPDQGKEVKGIIVIISDAFGWAFVNNRILADHYAARGGFKVYLPDFMDGTAAPVSLLTSTNSILEDFSLLGWAKKPFQVASVIATAIPYTYNNAFPKSWPKVLEFMNALRTSPDGAKLPIGAAGFCWGGKHTINLAHGYRTSSGVNLIDAAFTAHPSNLVVPDEIEKVRLPLSIAQPEKDLALKPAQYSLIKENLGGIQLDGDNEGEKKLQWECIEYKDATHGFAVRADSSKDEATQAEEAEEQAVRWFEKHFAAVKR